jgi:hypothetical protein
VAIGGLRQRNDTGEFNGIPYLKDLNVIGRLFRSRDLDVREGELVVFISPEIISYSDEPTCRQKLAEDTIRCRLDQVPEGEGCPPCCRRLPCRPDGALLPDESQPVDPTAPVSTPTPTPADGQLEQLPQPSTQPAANDSALRPNPYSPEPLLGGRLSSSRSQVAVTGGAEPTSNPARNNAPCRLPVVVPIETRVTIAPTAGRGIFPAPPALNSTDEARTADREAAKSIWR